MKVYRVELMILDFDGLSENEMITMIENSNYPNDCISPMVVDIKAKEIGQWRDDHPLNDADVASIYFRELFKEQS